MLLKKVIYTLFVVSLGFVLGFLFHPTEDEGWLNSEPLAQTSSADIEEKAPSLEISDIYISIGEKRDTRILGQLSDSDVVTQKKGDDSSPKLPSQVSFDESAYKLMRDGVQQVAISSTNVDVINIRVFHLDERAILESISSGDLLNKSLSYWRLKSLTKSTISEVWRGEFKGNTRPDTAELINLPLNEVFEKKSTGLFLVAAESSKSRGFDYLDGKSESGWDEFAVQWINYTDLSLSSFDADNGLFVGVRSYATGKSLGDVTVHLLAKNNEILDSKPTSSKELVHFLQTMVNGKGAHKPRAIYAIDKKGDFSFLDLSKPALDLTNFDVSGAPSLIDQNIFMFSDRGVYRPNESIHLSGMLRNDLNQAIASQQVGLHLKTPQGVLYQEAVVSTNEQGWFEHVFKLPSSAIRGEWVAQANVDSTRSRRFSVNVEVKDFVPELIDVVVKDKLNTPTQSTISASVESKFLYGAPASGLTYDAQVTYKRTRTPFGEYKRFLFGKSFNDTNALRVNLPGGKLSTQGTATFNLDLVETLAEKSKEASRDFHMYNVSLKLGVQEPGGRFKYAYNNYVLDKADHYVGIRPGFSDDEIDSDTKAQFSFISLDSDGKQVVAGLKWKLFKIERSYRWVKNESGSWRYERSEHSDIVEEGRIENTVGNIELTSSKLPWGYYRLVVDGVEPNTLGADYFFYSGYVWDEEQSSEMPSRIAVYTDKKQYKVGQTINTHFESLFDGVAQVVVANESIQKVWEIPVQKGKNTLSFKYEDNFKLGAYILINAMRPASQALHLPIPVRTLGVTWVSKQNSPVNLVMDVPTEVKPRQTVWIPIQASSTTSDALHVSVNAIDEGVLSITNYQTPRPHDFYTRQRQLEIDLRDDYNRLLKKSGQSASIRTGAGQSISGTALNVIPSKTITVFDKEVTLDEDGHGMIELDIPDFQGSLRLMAFASSKASVGSAEQNLIVRDPLVSTVVMPNYLAPNDMSLVTVRYYNSTDERIQAKASWTSKDEDVMSVSNREDEIVLLPQEVVTKTYPIVAGKEGVGSLTLNIHSDDFDIARHFDMQVRYQGIAIPKVETQRVETGEVNIEGIDDPSIGHKTVSFQRAKNINIGYLQTSITEYPWSCSEQLTSKGTPMLAEYSLGQTSGFSKARMSALKEAIQSNIDTILSRVNSYGRLGLWGYDSVEVSAGLYPFINEYLINAKREGFTVPMSVLESLVNRMMRQGYHQSSHPEVENYSAYVATMFDPTNIRFMHKIEAQSSLDHIRQALAYSTVGQTDEALKHVKVVVDAGKSGTLTLPERYDYYQSAFTYQANLFLGLAKLGYQQEVLKVFEDYFAETPITSLSHREASLVMQVMAELAKNNSLIVTREIDGFQEALPKMFLGASLSLKGDEIQKDHSLELLEPAWMTTTLYRTLTDNVKGVDAQNIKETVYSLDREQSVDWQNLRVGERIKHTIEVKLGGGMRESQYMISVPLPAGLEVEEVLETSRVLTPSDYYKEKALDMVQVEFDKVIASTMSGRRLNTVVLEFVSRVVTPGEYVKPGVRVENMYRPTDLSIGDQMRIKIK